MGFHVGNCKCGDFAICPLDGSNPRIARYQCGFQGKAMVSTHSTSSLIIRFCLLGLALCCLGGLIVLATTEASLHEAFPSRQAEETIAASNGLSAVPVRKVRTVPIDSNGQPIAEQQEQ
jgi:hypothetical protein